MRQQTEAAVALAGLALLLTLAGVLGRAHAPPPIFAPDASTFRTDPTGAQGLFDAVGRLGIDARRYRGRATQLPHLVDGTRQILVELDPSTPFSTPETQAILQFGHAADLLLAGPRAASLMQCFGYKVDGQLFDSTDVAGLGNPAPRVNGTLSETHLAIHADSSRLADIGTFACRAPVHSRVTVLLASARGPVAIRIDSANGSHSVILVSDAALFRNRQLRDTDAGVFALNLLASNYQRVVFDEYHHGYHASGSLVAATVAWSRQSPWGWMAWQLAAVGVLALLSGALRFGPAIPVIVRQRRSSLEHVEALANALSAAHGHDQAIGAIVRGLRRRLAPPLLRSRGDWRAWMEQLGQRAVDAPQQVPVRTLQDLTRPGQPASSVLGAAHAVEDIWQNLRH